MRPPGVVRACCCVFVQEHDLCPITLQCDAKRTFSSHFTSHCTFHSPHFTVHTSHPTLHLIPSLPHMSNLSKFFSTVFISSEHLRKFISTHLISSAHQKDLTVRAKYFEQKNIKHARLLHTEAEDIHLHTKILTTYFVLQSLHKAIPSTTLYYKAFTKCISVPCTTKLAQSTSQYHFVLHSLHKVHFPVLLCTKQACTKHFPVLLCTKKACATCVGVPLCTTKLSQSASQSYFVLQSLHKVRPSITLYCTACTKCTSKYYFVLQSLHNLRPSTTLY